eukprot:m.53813 g.53813  ORF g.53813 m.53813 type:complete len:212 (-) comp48644_c0_seq2:119-754(-)
MHLKLTYFTYGALAEPVRIAFHIGSIEYEDERLTRAVFAEQKAAKRFPTGTVPVLWVDGEPITQSNAVLMFACRVSGLYPTDLLAQAKVDEVLAQILDVSGHFGATVSETDETVKKQRRTEIAAGPLAAWCEIFDGRLKSSESGFLVGNTLTAADLKAYGFFTMFAQGLWDYLPKDYIDRYTHIVQFIAKIRALPKVREFYALEEARVNPQ